MSYEMASPFVDIFYETIGNFSSVDGVYRVLIWQQIVEGSLKGSVRSGSHAMGFIPADGPLQIIMLACQWNSSADDDKVYKVLSDIMKQVKDASVELGVANDWVYMNYASQFQDVITSHGDASKAKLKKKRWLAGMIRKPCFRSCSRAISNWTEHLFPSRGTFRISTLSLAGNQKTYSHCHGPKIVRSRLNR